MSSRAKNSERLNFISKLSKNSAGSIADFKRLSRSFVKALRRFAHKVRWVFRRFSPCQRALQSSLVLYQQCFSLCFIQSA
ncbi:hypothetical protein FXN59_03030 [Aggregatibacter actinomycetemcomitans]|nr:hypothetical protein FXN59_03030 [Aggregatibacter actinomycetemcomitans]TYA49707.1 hypothetical protein FXB74_03070 [Aggregatibacter actinomycetemcomitans]